MWIERLDIRGFKRLTGGIELSPGLTIVCGVNEAGKSSLHDAILRALFGFTRSELRRTGGESEQDRCRPWNAGAYALNAIVHTAAGRHQIEWDFAEHEVGLRNLDTGEDLTSKVTGKRGEAQLGPYLLGLDLEDFRRACCVEQGEISAVPKSESLVAAMQQAVEAGGGHTGVEAAVELLNKALSEQIGARRDNLGPTPKGRLRGLLDQKEEIQGKLDAAETEQEEIATLEQDRRQVQGEREQAEAEQCQVEQGLLRAEEARLSKRLREIQELEERTRQEVPEGPDIAEDTRSAITVRQEELDGMRRERASLEPRAEAARKPVEELEARRADLERERASLTGYDQIDASRADEVQGLLARRESQIAAAAAAPAEIGADTDQGATPAFLWLATGVAAIGSLALAVAVSPAALAGLAIAAVLAYLAVRAQSAQTQAERQSDAIAEEHDAAAKERDDMERKLAEILDAIGMASAEDVGDRARRYLDACKHHHRRNGIDAELGRIRSELVTTGEPITDLRQVEERIQGREQGLRERYEALEIDAADLAAAGRKLDHLADLSRKRAAARQEVREAESNLKAALGGQTVAELEESHAEAEAKLRENLGRHGELTAAGSQADLTQRRQELDDELRERSNRHSTLQGQIQARERQLPDVPALREQLQRIELEVSELELASQAIATAREALGESARQAHSAFRPRLKEALDRNLGRITDGRYDRVELDEDLEVTLVAPETGQLVPATRLSRGTQDQIYFLERLEILDMLDPTSGDAPLLLDEPFVHYDNGRLEGALDLLAEQTRERQVILFTCHEALVEAARHTREDAKVINLDGPDGAA